MKREIFFKCPHCSSLKKKNMLIKKKNYYFCSNCNEAYPLYKKIPVLLTFKDDIYNLKKALLPAKLRINTYED